jgi:toxin FitB
MLWLCDTSVAVPYVQSAHRAHEIVRRTIGERRVGLPSHAALETYSVLTRLPGDSRLDPSDAATLIERRFEPMVTLDARAARRMIATLAKARIAGGAAYDALIGLTARHHDATLLTRDRRASATYAALDVSYELILENAR